MSIPAGSTREVQRSRSDSSTANACARTSKIPFMSSRVGTRISMSMTRMLRGRRRADVDQHALAAPRLARDADAAAVQDEAERQRAALLGRDQPLRSSSTFTGSVSFVSFRRFESRRTCVSTGRPGRPNATERTTLPVLRPTPGSVTRSSSSVGTSPSKRSSNADAIPMRLFVFWRKNPVEWMSSSTSPGPRAPGRSASGTERTGPA